MLAVIPEKEYTEVNKYVRCIVLDGICNEIYAAYMVKKMVKE